MQLSRFLGKNKYGVVWCDEDSNYKPKMILNDQCIQPCICNTEKEARRAYTQLVTNWTAFFKAAPVISNHDDLDYLEMAMWKDSYIAIVCCPKKRMIDKFDPNDRVRIELEESLE